MNLKDALLPSRKYEFFISIITDAVKSSSPFENKFIDFSEKNQFSSGILSSESKRLCRTSFRKWQHSFNLISYKKISALITKTLKRKKKKSL